MGRICWAVTAMGVLVFLSGLVLPLTSATSVPEKSDKGNRGRVEGANVPLVLKLTAKENSFTLNLGGKNAEEFRAWVKNGIDFDAKNPRTAAGDKYPAAPKVDLLLELRNDGEKAVDFLFGRRIAYALRDGRDVAPFIFGGGAYLDFEVKGPGALRVENGNVEGQNRDAEGYRPIPLGSGKAFSWPLRELRFGPRYYNHPELKNRIYWTQSGEYQLRSVLHSAVDGGGGAFKPIQVYSNWITLKVVAR